MKIYRVVTERDGVTKKGRGEASTELLRDEFRFAAETMSDVWDAIDWLRNDPERTLLALIEEAPAITVLPPNAKEQHGSPNRSRLAMATREAEDANRRARLYLDEARRQRERADELELAAKQAARQGDNCNQGNQCPWVDGYCRHCGLRAQGSGQ